MYSLSQKNALHGLPEVTRHCRGRRKWRLALAKLAALVEEAPTNSSRALRAAHGYQPELDKD
jgi:hypothetical protein